MMTTRKRASHPAKQNNRRVLIIGQAVKLEFASLRKQGQYARNRILYLAFQLQHKHSNFRETGLVDSEILIEPQNLCFGNRQCPIPSI